MSKYRFTLTQLSLDENIDDSEIIYGFISKHCIFVGSYRMYDQNQKFRYIYETKNLQALNYIIIRYPEFLRLE